MGTLPLPSHILFRHVVLKGTSYDVGEMQGHMLKDDPGQYRFITSFPPGMIRKKYSKGEFREVKDFFAEYCPGINEEIEGTADALSVSDENITYYYMAHSRAQHCSHFVVLPPLSKDHVYAGRNYDLHPAFNDLRLCTTHVKGHYAHIGFSEDFFGRTEGMNEQGLCITTSKSGNRSSKDEGFLYHAVVRTLLDRCKTVGEALETIQQVPMADYQNFIIIDRHGEAALVEIAGSKKGVKKIGQNSESKFLCATNHYTLPETIHFDRGPRLHSVIRYKTLETRLKNIPHVKKDTIREILSDPMPKGACCHHYANFLGTLWSMVFDVTDINVEICFGTPHRNTWRLFGLHDPVGLTTYAATLCNDSADPMMWKKVSSG